MPINGSRNWFIEIRVLHNGVTLSGIGDMGPMLLLTDLQGEDRKRVGAAAKVLPGYDREQVPLKKSA